MVSKNYIMSLRRFYSYRMRQNMNSGVPDCRVVLFVEAESQNFNHITAAAIGEEWSVWKFEVLWPSVVMNTNETC